MSLMAGCERVWKLAQICLTVLLPWQDQYADYVKPNVDAMSALVTHPSSTWKLQSTCNCDYRFSMGGRQVNVLTIIPYTGGVMACYYVIVSSYSPGLHPSLTQRLCFRTGRSDPTNITQIP
jgi:hypothetical protein